MRFLLTSLIASLLLATPALAQRPKTADEALARFGSVADKPESERFRAVADLGDFADDPVTERLLAELQGAKSPGYRQAVIRALGEQTRSNAVPALARELQDAGSVRLVETIAAALGKQGDLGVRTLAEALAAEKPGSARVHALCDGLGRTDSPLARATLLAALQKASGRDRLPPLRGLAQAKGDADVDAQRLLLARDKDALVGATALQQLGEHDHPEAPALAVELSRKGGANAGSDVHTAVMQGLLANPTKEHVEALLVATARAEDPFRKARTAAWQRATAAPGCLDWFATAGLARKPSLERATAARVLGFASGDAQATAAAALAKALGQKEPDVVTATAHALAGLGAAFADEPLQKLLQGGGEALQPIALGALHQLHGDEATFQQQLLAHASAKGAPLRAAALQLLAATKAPGDAAVQAAAGNLADKAWQVRSAAIDLLRALRQPAGVPLLFERLEQEQGRLQKDLVEALQDLTALQFPTVAAWRDWWQKEGPNFRVASAKERSGKRDRRRGDEPATTASYWNLPVTSERVVFVVDGSGSMLQPFGTGSGTRLDEAKRQLAAVLAALPSKAKANVVVFSFDAKGFAPTLQTLDDKKKKAATTFAQAIEARGPTNVHSGLQLAFADPEVDTIYLLTDGQPSSGPVVDQNALLREVANWNLGRVVRIHTVAIGGRSRFLEQLAEQNGGAHAEAR